MNVWDNFKKLLNPSCMLLTNALLGGVALLNSILFKCLLHTSEVNGQLPTKVTLQVLMDLRHLEQNYSKEGIDTWLTEIQSATKTSTPVYSPGMVLFEG